jgi:hypothetical protein
MHIEMPATKQMAEKRKESKGGSGNNYGKCEITNDEQKQ